MDPHAHHEVDEPVWARPKAFGDAPKGYGWVDPKGVRHKLEDLKALLEVIAADKSGQVILVWTPDHSQLLIPEELAGAEAEDAVNRGRELRIESDVSNSRKWFVLGSGLLVAWMGYEWFRAYESFDQVEGLERWWLAIKSRLASVSVGIALLLWFALAFVPCYQSWDRKRKWLAEGRDSKALIPTLKFETWMDLQRVPVTRVLVALLLTAYFFQWWLPGNAVQAAGLVKTNYHAGEYWRLLTAPWLHGNLVHLFFNAMAMLYLGKRVELFARWPHLLNVLVLACISGGLASAYFHSQASVGISGGLMGWLGFLLVFETNHPRLVTLSARRRLLAGVLVIALMGAIGFKFIDNAAHAGGLVAGMIYAWIVFPPSASIHRPRVLHIDRFVGGLGGIALLVGASLAVMQIWSA